MAASPRLVASGRVPVPNFFELPSVVSWTIHKPEEVVLRVDGPDIDPPMRVRRRRVSQKERDFIWLASGQRCYICKKDLPQRSAWHVEHVIAFSSDREKNDVLGNMLAACPECNHKKLNKPLEECISIFGADLDTNAVNAPHLNTDSRKCLLRSLQIKRSLYHAERNEAAERYANLQTIIEEIVASDAADRLLPVSQFEIQVAARCRGSFGEIYKGLWRREANVCTDVALKFSTGTSGVVLAGELQALNELALCSGHPHIVQFHGLLRHTWSWSEDQVSYGLVFDWCDYTLNSREVNQKADLTELVAQVADALVFMHSKKYRHRDVKPMNVLVCEAADASWIAKLADMGLAKKISNDDLESQQHTENQGTSYFRAPEVRGPSPQYYEKTDVYALGKSMEFLRRAGISSLFKKQSMKLKIWKEVESESTRTEHTKRPKAKALRDRLRELPQPADLDVGGDKGIVFVNTKIVFVNTIPSSPPIGTSPSRLRDGDDENKKGNMCYHKSSGGGTWCGPRCAHWVVWL